MAAATLQTIDAAIFSTLERLHVSEGGPFVTVRRFVGQASGREREHQAAAAVDGATPALMLDHDEPWETYTLAPGMQTAALQQHAWVGTSRWLVFVIHRELAGHEEAVRGNSNEPGLPELVSVVIGSLSGLRIPGLYHNKRLEPVGTHKAYARSGQYIYLCRFKAERLVDSVPIPDDSVSFEQLAGKITSQTPEGVPFKVDTDGLSSTADDTPFQFEINIEQDE